MACVEGFLIAVPKANLEKYRETAQLGEKVWLEHGAIACVETVGVDVPHGELASFPRAVMAKAAEVLISS